MWELPRACFLLAYGPPLVRETSSSRSTLCNFRCLLSFMAVQLPLLMAVLSPFTLMAIRLLTIHPYKLSRPCTWFCILKLLVFLSMLLSPRIKVNDFRFLPPGASYCRDGFEAVGGSCKTPTREKKSMKLIIELIFFNFKCNQYFSRWNYIFILLHNYV